ncbi:MAG: methyltransferase [Flavobacteriales bacterium]|nr:methyltransferase [Flavobacteriales bacterium]
MFQFKQFTIQQDKTSMKVGTDGVLLGAWVNVENVRNSLDIGTGTGVISLMLAQRSNTTVCAIEIEEDAYHQANENFENSTWGHRISATHSSLQDYTPNNTFDLIVSNPPFFINSYKATDKNRNLARHTDSLSFSELLSFTSKNLSENGRASFIIPFDAEVSFIGIAKLNKLYPSKITRVKGTENTQIKRSLIELQFAKLQTAEDLLIIEISRHLYTKEYIELTKDFYLKM